MLEPQAAALFPVTEHDAEVGFVVHYPLAAVADTHFRQREVLRPSHLDDTCVWAWVTKAAMASFIKGPTTLIVASAFLWEFESFI